jgi:3-isopropylmalate/(R)-2-methylmalate dehydratase small subunit
LPAGRTTPNPSSSEEGDRTAGVGLSRFDIRDSTSPAVGRPPSAVASHTGRVWKFGDDISTDEIAPGKYLGTTDPQISADHVLEGADPDFAQKVRKGDIIVAGANFGMGSSRERAPVGIQYAGVYCVIAKSFARIFFRNSINIGLPILECPPAVDGTEEGDELTVDLVAGTIRNERSGESWQAAPFPQFLQDLMAAGGLVEFARARLPSPG